MSAADALSAAALDWLRATAFDAAVIILAVAVLTRMLRGRLPPRWSYALWLLVPLRLVLPAMPEAPFSLHRFGPTEVAVTVGPSAPPAPDLDAFAHEQSMRRPPASSARAADHIAASTPAPIIAAPVSSAQSTPGESPEEFPWRPLLAGAWLFGVVALVTRLGLRERAFRRAIAAEPQVQDERVLALLAACCREAGVRVPVRVVRTEQLSMPAVLGWRRPRILVPGRILDTFTGDELRAVLGHELAHVRCRDGLTNWALALVQALHWYHPLVWFAFTRLRAERESVRDWMALAHAGAAPSLHYGNTLLRLLETAPVRPASAGAAALLEDKDDLHRRITMIARFRRTSRPGSLLGAALVLAVACATMTRAPAPEAAADDRPVEVAARPPASKLLRVRVEHHREVPAWESELRGRLAKTLDVAVEDGTVSDVVALLREQAELNVIVDPRVQDELEDMPVALTAKGIAAERVLRWAIRPHQLDYCLSGRAVYVGARDELPYVMERRFYDVRPLLEDLRPDDRGAAIEGLIDLTRDVIAPDAWDNRGASMFMWKELLVVDQDARVHAGVEGFVNLMLNRGKTADPATEPWRTALERKLAERVTVSFEAVPLADAAAQLSRESGVRIDVPADHGDEEVTLTLQDVPVSQVLEWFARFSRLRTVLSDGAVTFTEQPPLVYRAYPLADLLGVPLARDRGGYDELWELMRTSVSPASWEEYAFLTVWKDLLVVAQTEEVHREMVRFFEVLQRALDES